MTLNLFTQLTIISVFLTFVLSLFFFSTGRGSSVENKILAALLLVFNLQIIYSFLTSEYTYQYFMDWHKAIFLLRQTSFLIGPMFYLYVNAFLKRRDILTPQSLFHFFPFLSALIFLMFYYRFLNHFVIWLSPLDLYDTIVILLYNLAYIIASLFTMRSMNITVRGFYQSMKIAPHQTWLQTLLIGFIIIWIVNLNSFAIVMIARRPGWCAYTASIYALTAFLFVNALMFLLLAKPDIYFVITKYKSNKLPEDDKMEYLLRLNSYMETHKPYLNPEIALESLANEISVHPRILSQIINETYKKNFKSYILEFRIRESMKILKNSNCSKLTILEILYQVGFNSKSAFNNQFKLYTNLTPQEYRLKFVE